LGRIKVFARIVSGREEWHANALAPHHRHEQAYAAVVLAGSDEECGHQTADIITDSCGAKEGLLPPIKCRTIS
jgi:hypothetical protein